MKDVYDKGYCTSAVLRIPIESTLALSFQLPEQHFNIKPVPKPLCHTLNISNHVTNSDARALGLTCMKNRIIILNAVTFFQNRRIIRELFENNYS